MVLLKRIFTSRSLLGIILAALCLLLTMLTMTGMNPYIFPYYFKNTAAQSAVAMCSSVASLFVVAPLATMLATSQQAERLAQPCPGWPGSRSGLVREERSASETGQDAVQSGADRSDWI